MIIEFLIAYRQTQETDIELMLVGVLAKILEENLNEYDSEFVKSMIQLRHERAGAELSSEDGNFRNVLLGFALDLPEETEQQHAVINEFSAALSEAPPIFHVVKFEDPLLRSELARWSEEIFSLEMKLRRVLTFIYLHAHQAATPYDLLSEETVQPMAKPQSDQMKAATENQFFHLTFGQYVNLNKRPEFKLNDLLATIRDSATYDTFLAELRRSPVQHEDDAVLLAGLKERMDSIEAMRNCIAHNRRPSKRVVENYQNTRPLLDLMLDEYLNQWDITYYNDEMPWDSAAREAVEYALENADWDDATKKIVIHDREDDRGYTVRNRDELESHLAELASNAFYAYVPFDSGEAVFRCDEYGVVESALSDYEDRLEEFFREDETEED